MRANRATRPPDGGYGWVVLACCAICLSTVIGMGRIYGMIVVEVIEIYGVNRTEAFLIMVLNRIFGFAFAPLVGKLMTYFDYSVILCTGSLCLSFSLVLTAFTTAYWQVLITYGCLQGFGVNCVMATSALTVGQYFNKRRSLAMGIMYAIGGVNGFISPLLFNWLLELYHFHGALLIMGGLALHSCAFTMLVRQPTWIQKEQPRKKVEEEELLELSVRNPETGKESSSSSPPTAYSNGVGHMVTKHKSDNSNLEADELKELCAPLTQEEPIPKRESRLTRILNEVRQDLKLFKDGLFLLQLFNRTFVMITFAYFLPILPDFVEVELVPHVTKKEVAFVLSMASIGDILCRFVIGSVLDKLPWPKKHSLGGLSVCMGLTVLLFQFSQVYAHLVVVSVVFGLLTGMVIVVQYLVEIELMGPKRVHMANGLTRFVAGGANAVAGVLIGYMRDELGSYKVCLSLLGASGILGGLVWITEPFVIRCFPPQLPPEKTRAKDKTLEES